MDDRTPALSSRRSTASSQLCGLYIGVTQLKLLFVNRSETVDYIPYATIFYAVKVTFKLMKSVKIAKTLNLSNSSKQ